MESKIKYVLVTLLLIFPRLLYSQSTLRGNETQTATRARVIVFVHGLHGSRDSWRAANGAYWPDLIRTDPRFAYSDVEVAE